MPCITRARAAGKGFLLLYAGRIRWTTLRELAKLQGASLRHLDLTGLSHTEIGGMIGNAMSGCVLDRIIPRLLWSGGILKRRLDVP